MEEFMLAMLVSRPTSLGGVSSLGSRAGGGQAATQKKRVKKKKREFQKVTVHVMVLI